MVDDDDFVSWLREELRREIDREIIARMRYGGVIETTARETLPALEAGPDERNHYVDDEAAM